VSGVRGGVVSGAGAGAATAFDEKVDTAFAGLRGRAGFDRAASVVSNMADYGFVWVLLAGLKGRRSGPDRRRAVVALGAAGVSSLIVSRAAKAAVERQRPDEQVDALVRTPTSSSFPSGHTLAAFCTAIVLPESSTGTAACVAFASAVAVSRVHLRAHHATDVLGGAVIGGILGLGLRPVVRFVTPGTRQGRIGGRKRGRAAKGMGQQDFVLHRL
jgi:undecaprenyl-diphosphatase